MAEGGHLDHALLVRRFRGVIERYRFDGRADRLPEMADRLNEVERDWLVVDLTEFEFPEDQFR